MVVVEQRDLFGLHPGQQVRDRGGELEPHSHRDGVDEQPDHRLDSGEFHRSPGDGGAERHVFATNVVAQHDSPRHLNEGIHRDPELTRRRRECTGPLLVEDEHRLAGRRRDLPAPRRRRQRRRFFRVLECQPPRLGRRRRVTLAYPFEVCTVRPHRRQHRVVTTCRVQREQVLDQQRPRPAVEQKVVAAEHERVPTLG